MTESGRPGIHAPEEIETERLVLRRSADERDKAAIVAMIREGGLEAFGRWSGFIVGDISNPLVEEEFENFSLESNKGSSWLVSYTLFTKERDEIVGYVTIDETGDGAGTMLVDEAGNRVGFLALMGLPLDPVFAEAEWYVYSEKEGLGYDEEALRAVIGLYFSGGIVDGPDPAIVTLLDSRKLRALTVAERLGFRSPITSQPPTSDYEEDEEPDEDGWVNPVGTHRVYRLDTADFATT